MSDAKTTSAEAADENPFWRFSLGIYDEPGVAQACLSLQDRHAAADEGQESRSALDVNLLLFCCWAGRCGRMLLPGEIASLIAAADPWQREVVSPLRGVRRWLKVQESVPGQAAEALRAQVKTQELEAERLEQGLLHAVLPLSESFPAPPAAIANLQLYFIHTARIPYMNDFADLASLVTATFRDVLPPLNALWQLQDWPEQESGPGPRAQAK